MDRKRQGLYLVLFIVIFSASLMGESEADQGQEALWKRAVGGKITSWQAVGPDGTIYLIGDDRALHALSPRSGKDLWLYRPGGRLTSFLAVSADGTVYIQNSENVIFAVNPGGEARWKCIVDSPVQQMPVLTPEGTVIFLLDKGVMAALSRKGEILWTLELDSMPTASPVIDYRGQVYVAVEEGIICCNLEGERKWSLGISGINRLAVDRTGRIFGLTESGRIRSLSHEGKLIWDSGTDAGKVVTLALREDDVLIQTESGVIFRADSRGGESFYQGLAPLTSGYLSEEGRLCFFDENNRFISLDFEKGEERVLFTVPAVPSLPLVTERGLILFGASDWRFYAFKGERPDRGWSQFRANPRRDGSLYSVLSPEAKEELYRDDSRWIFYNYFVTSENSREQMELVEEVRSYGDDRALLEEEVPFWDLLMMKLTESRDDRTYMVGDGGYTDNPLVRSEAYLILGEWAVFPARNSIISQMRQEKDPLVLSSACYALGQIASDWDGKSTDAIGRIIRNPRFLADPRLAETTGRALESIMLYNGGEVAAQCWEYYGMILESPVVDEGVKERLLAE
ncbi:MAG: PQQ-binding-like beta-propeller repeat protein [Spirochaetales bacterium]|nr:PQQ-binding-like beta-propeller repeat protein [Spirochaetales bacterium]